MTLIDGILLAIVEGVTEFLPISSTGHLLLLGKLLGTQSSTFTKSFEIIIQLGAILAVVSLYFRQVITNIKLWKILLVAFLPSMVVGLVFYNLIKSVLLDNNFVTLSALFIGGIVIIILEKRNKNDEHATSSLDKITYKQAFLTGVCQSLSVVPGVSRAAATILGGMFLGMSRKSAVEFSFLLAIPTMFAASALDVYKSFDVFTIQSVPVLISGFIISFVVALIAVKWLLGFVGNHSLLPFGVYRIVFAILYAVLFLR